MNMDAYNSFNRDDFGPEDEDDEVDTCYEDIDEDECECDFDLDDDDEYEDEDDDFFSDYEEDDDFGDDDDEEEDDFFLDENCPNISESCWAMGCNNCSLYDDIEDLR